MTIKICGITRAEDAMDAIAAGADALGFNFYEGSPRYIAPEAASRIATPGVLRVGVFVNAGLQTVSRIAELAQLDIVQLHGDEDPADYPQPMRVWKAYRIRDGWRAPATHSTAEAVLLDGPLPGCGVSFDWRIAEQVRVPFVLAGGLGPDNVTEAIRITRPWGIDACSRLESNPGIKDPEKVAQFIRAARNATL